MKTISLKAYAKINLGLDVIARRANGYHDVRMIMQTLNLCDELTFTLTPDTNIELSTNHAWLPTNQNNLIYKAAKMMFDEFKLPGGLSVNLNKNIPVAAGMAGGSADAAATFEAINILFELGLSDEDLMKRAVSLGADIPYCIMKGTALSEGIGEVLSPLPPMPDCHILIAKPGISVSTKYVYEHLDLSLSTTHPKIDAIIHGINNQDVKEIADNLGNILETVTLKKYSVIQEIKDTMISSGALGSLMSGSGPTVFGLYTDLKTAQVAYETMKKRNLAKDVILTSCYNK
ncbi:4-diphosphocytidyl-2-C-methyl-D-erythritol kinase [Lachnospiraceae bacterium KM106-2]|nr:4-diphosphocytidyl-2-C-methyl-D-erythritol kinase [Lachnospiraceae bacterium KM106-2]